MRPSDMLESYTSSHLGARALLAAALLAAGLAACTSPNRGVWRGDFAGSVSGVVEFRINARGTDLTGTIEGETRAGQPFKATMEGKIKGEYFYATFEGTSRADLRPIPFDGFMKGQLGGGAGNGEWEAKLMLQSASMRGTWSVEQVEGEE